MRRTGERTEADPRIRGSIVLWREGINLLLRSFDTFQGYRYQNLEQETVLAGLLAHALNTEICGFHLASSGFYAQSMALVRICAEDWLAWYYVRECPDKAPLFRDPNERTPRLNDMLTKLESLRSEGEDEETRTLIKWLHRWAHVDSRGLRLSWNTSTSPVSLGIGPHYDSLKCWSCAGHFTTLLPPLLKAADEMRELCGVPPQDPGVYRQFRDKVLLMIKETHGIEGVELH